MKRIVIPLLVCVIIGLLPVGLRGDDLLSRLPSGPKIGQKIVEFRSQSAVGRHLCWGCYG